ncbi:hypothetical protein [Streptomyces kaempferi]|uniref:Uncharacterized protein n=1 Tax=Streptomyces kaempferi TaxID=333725 RepID=A0ABW3XLE8_9ACTN
MSETTPVDEDAHATPAQLLARAAQDLTAEQAAARKKEEQGSTGNREGVLPGSAA